MAKKIKTLIYLLDNYEWINIVSTILLGIVSITLFLNSSSSLFELMIITGLVAILKGFLNFNIFISLEVADKEKKGPVSFVYFGLFNILIGLFLILNIITNPIALLIISALWMVSDSIPYILYINKNKLGRKTKYNPFIFSFSLIMITAISHVATISTTLYSPKQTVALFLALSCLNLILLKKEKQSN